MPIGRSGEYFLDVASTLGSERTRTLSIVVIANEPAARGVIELGRLGDGSALGGAGDGEAMTPDDRLDPCDWELVAAGTEVQPAATRIAAMMNIRLIRPSPLTRNLARVREAPGRPSHPDAT